MSKRRLEDAHTTGSRPKRSMHWSLALLQAILDPKRVIKTKDKLVVIRAKYPKAKIHYLVVPFETISDIFHLKGKHIDLIEEFGEIYKQIKEETNCALKAGFLAASGMLQLHMHIMSTDMISPHITRKEQWNGFNTPFFVPYDDVLEQLKQRGRVKKIPDSLQIYFLGKRLQCNQCSHKPATIPLLMKHLLTHRPLGEGLEMEATLQL